MSDSGHPTELFCPEEFSDNPVKEVDFKEIEYFSPNYLYYFSLLAPNYTPPPIQVADLRMEMVDWILKVSSKSFLSRETAHIAITIFDKTTYVMNDYQVSTFLLVAMASLFVASKYLEERPIKIKTLNKYSDYQYSSLDVMKIEIKCLQVWKFRLPSVTLYQWVNFLCDEWDRYAKTVFNVPQPECSFLQQGNVKMDVILFRYPHIVCYQRYKRITLMSDLMIVHPKYYVHEHRLLAFAMLWKMIYAEFIGSEQEFFIKCGIPLVGDIFLDEPRNKDDIASDWLFDLLMQFSKLYIGDMIRDIMILFDFVDGFLLDMRKCFIGDEIRVYCSQHEICDRSYEELLAFQTYSMSYAQISKNYLIN